VCASPPWVWPARRRIPLLALSLLAGGLIEAVGCLAIGHFVRFLTAIPLLSLLVVLQAGVLAVSRYLARLREGAGDR
jgi:hypothetical protein